MRCRGLLHNRFYALADLRGREPADVDQLTAGPASKTPNRLILLQWILG